jgi:hypothetical protein
MVSLEFPEKPGLFDEINFVLFVMHHYLCTPKKSTQKEDLKLGRKSIFKHSKSDA